MQIIALTGLPATGTTTIGKYLKREYGFTYYKFSDFIREEAEKRGIHSPTRDDFQKIALEIRQEHGDGELARRIIRRAREKGDEKVVADGLRTMGEIEEIRKEEGTVIAVKSPLEDRLKRMKNRGRKGFDELNLSDLKERDKLELYSSDAKEGDLALGKTIKNAEFEINNNETLDSLYKKINRLLTRIKK